MRTEKVDGATTKYFYDGQMPIEEDYNPSGTVTKVTRNTLGGRGIEMISTTTSSGTEDRYPLYDGHGNMIATLGRNGSGGYAIGDSRTYDVWGSVRSGAASGDPTKRYSAILGHQADDESGLLYMRARYYEPGSGRFVSEDPALATSNLFIYCRNNPVSLVDIGGTEDQSDTYNHIMMLLAMTSFSVAVLTAMPMLGIPPSPQEKAAAGAIIIFSAFCFSEAIGETSLGKNRALKFLEAAGAFIGLAMSIAQIVKPSWQRFITGCATALVILAAIYSTAVLGLIISGYAND